MLAQLVEGVEEARSRGRLGRAPLKRVDRLAVGDRCAQFSRPMMPRSVEA